MCGRLPELAFLRLTFSFSTGGSPPYIPDDFTPGVFENLPSPPEISPQFPTENTNEPYLDWLKDASLKSKLPQTITTSYGDDEQTVPRDYAVTVCGLYAQLGVRGSSVLFSSGDYGVGGGDCKTNDGKNVTLFQPIFPASCKPSPILMRRGFRRRLTADRCAF